MQLSMKLGCELFPTALFLAIQARWSPTQSTTRHWRTKIPSTVGYMPVRLIRIFLIGKCWYATTSWHKNGVEFGAHLRTVLGSMHWHLRSQNIVWCRKPLWHSSNKGNCFYWSILGPEWFIDASRCIFKPADATEYANVLLSLLTKNIAERVPMFVASHI